MPRFLWFAPLAALVLALAVWSFRMGWIVATISETDVIEAWTAHYVAETDGARRSDCSAQPGAQKQVWILVTCKHSDGRRFDYPADRMGKLVQLPEPVQTPQEPRT